MAGITLEIAQELLDSAVAALKRAHSMEEYSIAGRSAKRSAVETASADVTKWSDEVKALTLKSRGRGRGCRVFPA